MRQTLTAVVIAAVLSTAAAAQGPTVAAAQSALGRCTYDTCALRIEPGLFNRRIYAGRVSIPVSMGLTGDGLVSAVERVPQALAEAQKGSTSTIVSLVGLVITSVAFAYVFQSAFDVNGENTNNAGAFTAFAVGTAAGVTSAVQRKNAERHFARAVWLYNRELSR